MQRIINNAEDIVISGISGRFPESNNTDEFWENLRSGLDMVTDDDRRWPPGLHGLPRRSGKVNDIECFDAAFFAIHPKQANGMNPRLRILMEVAYESIADAGVNPFSLAKSNTGVFVGCIDSEMNEFDVNNVSGYELLGGMSSMIANRLSYFLDLNGPSISVDTACSSSLVALDQALLHIRAGQCDQAIVAGTHLCLNPIISSQFNKLGMLSQDGSCKSFDVSANGYCRSEAVVCIYLQKVSSANRIYSTIVNCKSNCDGFKTKGVTYPSSETQKKLLTEVYSECDVSPSEVNYVEAHGTGTQAGDLQELTAITEVFCKEDRIQPLLIGSTKSNIGHAEPASGLVGMVKVILSMERKELPANLHYNEPNPKIAGLLNGKLQVVDKNLPFNGGYVGINSFGLGGSNVHVLLKSPVKERSDIHKEEIIKSSKVKFLTACGRTEEAVATQLNRMKEGSMNTELQYLLQKTSNMSVTTHPYRGYIVVNENSSIQDVQMLSTDNRPVWFVFSGMGSQWSGMAKDLMSITIFHKSIMKSDNVLQPYGIKLHDTIMAGEEIPFENVIFPFVAITAIQIALVDVMTSLNISPSSFMGHSIGEIACAYADGCLTAEQTVLIAYWRGRCIVDAQLPPGAMAVVGLPWEDVISRCPPGVVAACNNSKDNVTISGPPEVLSVFKDKLTTEGVFVKEVNSEGIAFHSPVMTKVIPQFKQCLDKIIPEDHARSPRWVSTSVAKDDCNTKTAKHCCTEYFTNNIVNPVLFHEAISRVPENAIVIEVSPYNILQAILRRTLPQGCNIVGLQKKNVDNIEVLFSGLGKLYMAGVNIDPLKLLNKPIQLPVSPGTPMLSPLIKWNHAQSWHLPKYDRMCFEGPHALNLDFIEEVDLTSDEDFYKDHVIDGVCLYPAAGLIRMAWKAYASKKKTNFAQTSVHLQNIEIFRPTSVPKDGKLLFNVKVTESGSFEIYNNNEIVCKGNISLLDTQTISLSKLASSSVGMTQEEVLIPLLPSDIYKEFNLKGYNYGPAFQGIISTKNIGNKGFLKCDSNWVTFLDSMIQMAIIGTPASNRVLKLPSRIASVNIDTEVHREYISQCHDTSQGVEVVHNKVISTIAAGGVEIRGLVTSLVSRQPRKISPIIQKYVFVPYDEKDGSKILDEINNNDANKIEENSLEIVDKCLINGEIPNMIDFQQYMFSTGRNNQIVQDIESLEACLDVVFENTGVYMQVTELEANKSQMYRYILPFLNNRPLLNINYIATGQSWNNNVTFNEDNIIPIEHDLKSNVPPSICNSDLAVFYHKLNFQEVDKQGVLLTLSEIIKPSGLLLVYCPKDSKELLTKSGFFPISEKSINQNASLFLCRKYEEKISKRITINISDLEFTWVDEVKRCIEMKDTEVILEADGSDFSGGIGLINAMRAEYGASKVRLLLNTEATVIPKEDKEHQLNKQLAMNVYKNGKWGSYRHFTYNSELKPTEHAFMNVLKRGDLSSLKWIESPLQYYTTEINQSSQLCTVHYASVNFRDIMLATGKLSVDAIPGNLHTKDSVLGLEFSGRDVNGKRVMGLVPCGGLATCVVTKPHMVFDVPDAWTLEDAATVPAAYATAYYALNVRAGINKGDRVLIHSGSGSVGQAAIRIALQKGCKVFTTVGTAEKKKYLQGLFPHLSTKQFANSRDCSFEQDILLATNGEGVDVILNSLSGEKLQASLRLLKQNGKFLEIGKVDLSNNTSFGMALFLKNITFHGILLDSLFGTLSRDWVEISECLSMGVANGTIVPLHRKCFGKENVEDAFRYMAQGKHMGKVLIKIKDEETTDQSDTASLKVMAIPYTYCHPQKSYVITGGLGGLGLELSQWLIVRGCKHLVVTSRSGITTGYQERCVREWRELGINIKVSTANVSLMDGAQEILETAASMAPMGGLFHLAMVLQDGLFMNQTQQTFNEVSKIKIKGVQNLDVLTRKHWGDQLDWFVVFSSMHSGLCNEVGQTSYAFANSYMERLCEKRKMDDLPGLAIQWGPVADVGVIARLQKTTVGGMQVQSLHSVLETLDKFMNSDEPVLSSFVLASKGRTESCNRKDHSLIEKIAHIYGTNNFNGFSKEVTLGSLGLDSLMAIEMQQVIEEHLSCSVSVEKLKLMTISSLSNK